MPANDAAPAPGPGATLAQWLTYLESIHPVEMELGLDRVLLVLRRLMSGRPRARVITVGGTNGKGSTAAALETLMLASGETVGTYTSPHLLTYNERVRINGREASDDAFIRAFEQVEAARRDVTLTYFEFGTLAAFLVMREAGVDNMVLEVGLGGRLDAVNVLDADLAIITSVDLDHTAWLGDDRDTIGFEKAGILRPGQTAVYADLDPPPSVLQQASAQRVHLLRPGKGYVIHRDGGQVSVELDSGRQVSLPANRLPVNSLAAAAVAAIQLCLPLDDRRIGEVLATVSLPGRFEQVSRRPDVFLDVGHNPHAAHWLSRRLAFLRRTGGYGRVVAVYGGLSDKDSTGVARALAPAVDQWFIGGLSVPRGLSGGELASRVSGVIPPERIAVLESVRDAIEAALDSVGSDGLVLVFGSFFTVAEGRGYFSG